MSAEIRRLTWQARRGSLELDILLSNYLKNHYSDRSPGLRRDYRLLLQEDDNRLTDWLVRGKKPPSPFVEITDDIVQSSRNHLAAGSD